MVSDGVDDNQGWGGGFYWQGGGAGVYYSETGYSSPMFDSPYFGWQIICGWSTCNGNTNPGEISILGLGIEATETSGPTVSATPGTLGAVSGWVRGWWPVQFYADGPSGACSLTASVNGIAISAPLNEPQTQTIWHQCPASTFSQQFDTASVNSGASIPLVMWASDAAYDYDAGQYLSGTATNYLNVDNQPVTVSLSGPTDAPTTAGTQYVTATASAGPSGVSGISCSLDGAASQWYPQASVRIPVDGEGTHTITCQSANNARDVNGNVARSAPASWSVNIRQQTASLVGFSKLVDPLVCRRVASRAVSSAVRHASLAPRRPSVRCHPRSIRRRVAVWTTVTRHGKRVRVKRFKTVTVVQLPHFVSTGAMNVGFGKAVAVSGWIGLASGQALADQHVQVLTAPADGLNHFSPAATATTGADGTWTAELPPGPSRLVEAVFDGNGADEPTASAPARLTVQGRVKLLRISPSRIPWGGTIHIVGQLEGGYLPPGGALVRLRIGYGSAKTTYGVQEHVTGDGRFSTTYTFGLGDPSVFRTYWFQIASLPMGNYPYAPAASGRWKVTVGG